VIDAPPLADLLRTYRTDARLSQEALAERAGVSARTIGDIETGIARAPRAITISLLAEALGLQPDEREKLRGAARRRGSATATPSRGARVAPPPLIGRDAELAELARLAGAARIVTITGGAGIGKTALALRFAHDAAERFGGNPVVVELAAIPDAALVPAKVALAAKVRESGGESAAAAIAAAIGDRPALFVLDNFEHVAAAAAFVAALAAAMPALQIVVTSRVPLRIAGERTLPLAPLRAGDATRLLVERARRDAPTFPVSDDEAAGIASIVRALDGIPLAIELAAPLLRMLPAAELARRLAHPLDVLVDESPDASLRKRTMRDAIAWSYGLLTPQQQVTMRRLGIFTGRFGLEAAQHVIADAPAADALATLRALAALADHSLVRVVEHGEGEPRFEIPALVRDYLAELLAQGDEANGLRERVAQYCIALVGGDGPLRAIAGDAAMNARLDLESPNFDAVLDWARATERIALGVRLAVRLRQFWWLRGAYAQGYAWLSTLLALAERTPIDDALLAAGHASAAGLAQAMARFDLSAEHIRAALPIVRASCDRSALASLLSGLGIDSAHAGDYASGRALLHEGLAIRRELGEPIAIAQSLCDLGSNLSSDGDYAAAGAHFEEALQLFRGAANDVGISATLANFALLALRTDMPARAESFAGEGLRIAERAGFDDGTRVARYLLARAALDRGDDAAAESQLRATMRASDDDSANLPASDVLQLRAAIEHARGHDVAAARILGAASVAPANSDVPQADARRAERVERAVRDALGPAFEGHWSAGRAGGFRRALAEVRPAG
jgi:predicted ATPase/DNA-binding XRE family transcriptional regulator